MNFEDYDNEDIARFLRNFRSRSNSDVSDVTISSESDNDETKVIVENKNIRIILRRARFRRFTRFNLDDHLFNIEILPRNNEEIEVLSVITLIEFAIQKSIALLKEEYASQHEQMFFLTVIDQQLNNGINSGGVDFNEDSEKIANFISLKLLRYLVQSNEHLKINNSFKIAIKIATRHHVEYRKATGRLSGIRIGIFTGEKLSDMIHSLTYTLNNDALSFKCLIVSAILGKSHYFAHYQGQKTSQSSTIWEKRETSDGLNLIQSAVFDFQAETNLNDLEMTYLTTVLSRLEYFLNCQFAILKLHSDGENFDCSFRSSEKFSCRIPVIYLLLEQKEDNPMGHISLITNIYQFYKSFNKTYCPYCHKKSNFRDKHICKNKELSHCRSCWRSVADNYTMTNDNDNFLFCFPNAKEEKSCLKCCRIMKSNECCFEHKYQCRKVFYCTLCKHYISTGPQARSIDKIKETHDCAMKKCHLCYMLYTPCDEKQHLCKISQENGQTKWSKLCLVVKEEDNITIIKEGNTEEFSLFDIMDNSETSKCLFSENYLPPKVRNKLGNKDPFLQQSLSRNQMDKLDWKNKNWKCSVLHFFLKKVLTDIEYQNCTIFYINKNEDFPLNEILRTLLEANISEFKLIQKESRVLRIRFQSEDICFQEVTNFLPKHFINLEIVQLLMKFLKLIEDCLEMQCCFDTLDQENKMPFLHPFSGPFATLAGFTYAVYKRLFLRNLDIFAIKDENGFYVNSSKEEIMWVQWEIFKRKHDKNQEYFHCHSPLGQKRYKACHPDLVIKSKKQTSALFYHGCYRHCCDRCEDGLRNVGTEAKSRQQIIERDKKKLQDLKNEVPGIKIKVIYGCDFKKELENPSSSTKNFLKFYAKKSRPKKRLNPRHSLRGGRTEVFCPQYEVGPDEEIIHLDINSSYPFQAFNEFPVGEYSVIIGDDLNKVAYNWISKKYCIKGDEVFGLVHCKVIAPKNLTLPYLGYRHTVNGETFVCYSLCKGCSEKQHTRNRKCTHGEKKRSFVVTITSIELNSLRHLGYEIELYEIYQFWKKDKIFHSFMGALNRMKIKYEGFPTEIETFSEQLAYIKSINSEFGYQLTEFEKNPDFRKIWKSAMVSFLGKFGEQQINKSIKFISNFDGFEEHVFVSHDQGKKVYISEVTEDLCQVSIVKKPNGKRRKGNLIYTAFVNAMARDKLYFDMMKLKEANFKVLYVDTDAVVFAKKKGQTVPLTMGKEIGQWKIEHDNIKSFHCLGLKNYILCYNDSKIEPTIKICGLRNDVFGKEYLEKYKNLVEKSYLNQPLEKIVLRQEIRVTKHYETEIEMSAFSLKNQKKRRVFFLKDGFIQSLPFGYVNQL